MQHAYVYSIHVTTGAKGDNLTSYGDPPYKGPLSFKDTLAWSPGWPLYTGLTVYVRIHG